MMDFRSWLFVGFLACAPKVYRAAGSSRCECATQEDLQATGMQQPPGYPADYGVGCRAHDKGAHLVPCGSSCADQWCYIRDGKTCTLPSHASFLVAGWWFSYETCGYLDYYTSGVLFHQLKNETVNYVKLTNSGGWRGSYCKEDLTCSGSVHDILESLLSSYAGRIRKKLHGTYYLGMSQQEYEGFYPRVVVDEALRQNPGQSEFGADDLCVYATGMGYMDICVQAMSVTPERQRVSEFIRIYNNAVILVAPMKKQTNHNLETLFQFVQPFGLDAWLLILTSFAVVALSVLIHERREGGEYQNVAFFRGLRISLYRTFGFVVGAADVEVRSGSGKTLKMALGFASLFVTSTYTANLASALVVKNLWAASIKGINDIKKTRSKVCAGPKVASTLIQQEILGKEYIFLVPERSKLLRGVQEGLCAAAVIMKEDYDQSMSLGDFCDMSPVGPELFSWPMGVPVSSRFHQAIGQGIIDLTFNGTWLKLENKYQPPTVCDAAGNSDGSSLTYFDMLGPFIVVGILVILASFEFLWQRHSPQPRNGRGIDPVETPSKTPDKIPDEKIDNERLARIAKDMSTLVAELGQIGKKDDSSEGSFAFA